MAVQFFSADARVPALPKTKLKSFINELFIQEGKILEELGYIFCSDEYLLKINQQFLQHDYYTDIITFDISERKRSVKGEIYISVDRVKDNARQLGETAFNEFLRVIFHGALHLSGYMDKTKSQQKMMRDKEDYYLSKFHR